jgi:hypothetical protein
VREPGRRLLGDPKPVAVEAEKEWEFAWLSEAAYGRLRGARRITPAGIPTSSGAPVQETVGFDAADAELIRAGWTPWLDFPGEDLSTKIMTSNLRVEIWEKKEPPSVAVAFGGTVSTSGKDWKSNLRWFLPFHNDEYTEIVKIFGPAFVSEFLRRAKGPGGGYLRNATIFSTGHSLGGGLAQQFAYSMPVYDSVPRVRHVYAFDPSPVTGFYSVDRKTRDLNKNGLSIDRIYERGEVLAIVRSLTSFIAPPSAVDPRIRAVRYSLFHPTNPISGHSMFEFARKLQVAARH